MLFKKHLRDVNNRLTTTRTVMPSHTLRSPEIKEHINYFEGIYTRRVRFNRYSWVL